MAKKKTVVLSFLGTTLDASVGTDRWSRWRPTVALCQHDDLLIDRLELLRPKKYEPLAKTIRRDIEQVAPETGVVEHDFDVKDAWDFEEVFAALHAFADSYRFDTTKEDYLVHITTGTHVAQICLFLLTEARYLPGRLLQTSPPNKHSKGSPAGTFAIIVLCLTFRNMPVGVRATISALSQLDRSLDEASATLRASTSRTFLRVIVPLLRPAIIASLVFSFTHAITAVSAVIFLATARHNLATVYIAGRVEVGEYALAIAYSSVLIVIMLVCVLMIQRFVGAADLGRRPMAGG